MRDRKISLNRMVLIYMFFISLTSIASLGALWVASELSRFQKEAAVLRSSYIEEQKSILKREVGQAYDFVNYMQSKTEMRLREAVKNRVYEASAIAQNIYNNEKEIKTIKEIKASIKNALRPIRFNKGRGYYFAFTLDGIETLFPVKPELEGTSMLQMQGGQGESVVPDMLALVSRKGQGFYNYTWPKPGHEGFSPKIAFVKVFEPTGWVIGTGEYLDDVQRDIQEECLAWISNIKFDQDGYVFVGQWDGLSLTGPAAGANMHAVTDANGVKIVQELIKTAQRGGGFVNYILPKFEGKKQAPKLSYVVGVPEWQWYIGSGVYVDEIEEDLDLRKSALHQRIRTNIRNKVIVLITVLIVIAILIKLLSNRLRDNLLLFTNFFTRVSTETIKIKSDALHFSEFSQLAKAANEMVAKRIQAELALQENEARLKAIIENAPDAFLVYDLQGRIIQVNEAACRSLGYSRDELMTMSVLDIEQSVSREEAYRVWKSVADGNIVSLEGFHQHKNGSRFPIEVTIASVQHNGETLLFGFAKNITERIQLERDRQKYQNQIIQVQKMEAIGTLAGGMAHDFNNLLMSIQGRASIMTYDLEDSHPCTEHAKAIMEATRSAAALTRQLLGVARGGKYEVRPIDINAAVQSSLDIFGRTKKEIRIHTKLNTPPPIAAADRRQIEQVLLNMYINAWQAMPQGGDLFLETATVDIGEAFCKPYSTKPGKYVKIAISDTGIGMDKATQQQIFDPFFTTKDKVRGTGLGLASAYGIITNHAGMITVTSEEGQGTTFNIYFPISEEDVQREEIIEERLVDQQSGTVLLVDDEKTVIDVGRAMLEKLGYQVVLAQNGEEAIDAIVKHDGHIDLVILDMIMPGMGGAETFDHIRRTKPELPVILSSGYAIDGQATIIMNRGCNGFIQKPFSIPELASLINKIQGAGNKTRL